MFALLGKLERGIISLVSPELLHAVLVQAVRGGHHRAGVDEGAAADVPGTRQISGKYFSRNIYLVVLTGCRPPPS